MPKPPQPPGGGARPAPFPPPVPGIEPTGGTTVQDSGQWFAGPPVSTAPAPESGLLPTATLVLIGANAPFVLTGREQYLVGRKDAEDGIYPEVDLTLSGGEEAGVSRRHAMISVRQSSFWLEDLDSLNYTFVNNSRLEPNRPQPLRDGDEVSFANIRMRFQMGQGRSDWR